jgi:PAS domain S-box-containing protein
VTDAPAGVRDWLETGLSPEGEAGRERMRLAIENFGLAFFHSDLRKGQVFLTPNAFAMFGLPAPDSMPVASAPFWDCYHPDDIGWARERFAADIAGARDSYRERVRILRRDDGALRWIEFSGRIFGPPGARTHIVGMLRDVTEAVEAEDRQRMLMREVDHRANNALAVVQSLIHLTRGGDVADYQARLDARVRSLARTQSLVAEAGAEQARAEVLAGGELAAWRDHVEMRIGAVPPLARAAIQPLAMILHELSTNAAKHGALSVPGGRVVLAIEPGDEEVRLRWAEAGGPGLEGTPARQGTGFAVMRAQLRRLDGTAEWQWAASGLVLSVRIPLRRWAS